jgi:hypothetical protein
MVTSLVHHVGSHVVMVTSLVHHVGSHVVMVTSLVHHVGSHLLTSVAVRLLPWKLNLGSIHGNTPRLL